MKEVLNLFSLKNKNNNRNDFLKIIAIITMTIDHIGVVFLPQVIILRVIGRLALPIFALGIANGYRYTSSLKNYLTRILVVGLISQIPYGLLFGTVKLNILFLFFVSLGTIYIIDKKLYLGIIPLVALLYLFPIEYGWYGVAMILLFYFLKENRVALISSLTFIITVYTLQAGSFLSPYQILGIFLAIYLPKNFCKIKVPRNLFYWFYPIHLLILYIIKLIIL